MVNDMLRAANPTFLVANLGMFTMNLTQGNHTAATISLVGVAVSTFTIVFNNTRG